MAKVKVTVDNKTMGATDKQLPDFTYTVTNVSGVVNVDDLTVTITAEPTKNDAGQLIPGSYTITGTCASTDNWDVEVVNGTLTVELGDYVCWNMQTGVYYKDVGEGLTAAKAGETIQMLAHDTSDSMLLWAKTGTKLDLNGFTVKADYVIFVNGSDLIDNSTSNAGLMIPNQQFTLGVDNDQVPVYDVDRGGYAFSMFAFNQKLERDEVNGTAKFSFVAYLEPKLYSMLADGGADNKLEIAVVATMYNETSIVRQNYVYLEEMVIDVVTSNGGLMYTCTISNFDKYLEYGPITLTATFQSPSGAVAEGTSLVIPQK